eukprot:Sspe_Gene.57635::Locus_31613_Transcript_1_1_Confidence_1.000_Length_1708::g.57635::m.57635
MPVPPLHVLVHPLHTVDISHVQSVPTAPRPTLLHRLFQCFLVTPEDHHLCTPPGKLHCDAPPNAPAATGHHSNMLGEVRGVSHFPRGFDRHQVDRVDAPRGSCGVGQRHSVGHVDGIHRGVAGVDGGGLHPPAAALQENRVHNGKNPMFGTARGTPLEVPHVPTEPRANSNDKRAASGIGLLSFQEVGQRGEDRPHGALQVHIQYTFEFRCHDQRILLLHAQYGLHTPFVFINQCAGKNINAAHPCCCFVHGRLKGPPAIRQDIGRDGLDFLSSGCLNASLRLTEPLLPPSDDGGLPHQPLPQHGLADCRPVPPAPTNHHQASVTHFLGV